MEEGDGNGIPQTLGVLLSVFFSVPLGVSLSDPLSTFALSLSADSVPLSLSGSHGAGLLPHL